MREPTPNRTLLVGMMMQGAALLAVMALLVFGWVRIAHDEAATRAALLHQTQNRALNVGKWCGAIDDLELRLGAYIHAFQRHGKPIPSLNLKRLPCKKLQQQTIASAKVR